MTLRRSNTHPHLALQPDLPGGEIENGEALHVGAIREVWEETGLKISPEDLIHLYAKRPAGYQHSHALYAARLPQERPKVVISWEHDQAEWLPLSELLLRGLPERDHFYVEAVTYLQENHERLILHEAL